MIDQLFRHQRIASVMMLLTLVSVALFATASALPPLTLRHLTVGDFASLNDQVFQNVVINLPPTSMQTEIVAGSTADINVDQIECYNLNVGDLQVDWNVVSSNSSSLTLQATLNLIKLAFDCNMQYNYQYLFFSGGGGADLVTSGSNVTAQLSVSMTLDETGAIIGDPVTVVDNCQADIGIESFLLDGDGTGLVASALNAVQGAVQEKIASEIESFLCTEVASLDQALGNWMIGLMSALTPPDGQVSAPNPLAAETALQVDKGVVLLDFLEPSSTLSVLVTDIMSLASDFVAGKVETESGTDLNINVLLRQLLGDSGLAVDLSGVGENGILMEEETVFGNFTVRMKQAAVEGWDSFSSLDPLNPIGSYTLSTAFALDDLRLQLQLELAIETGVGSAWTEEFAIEFSTAVDGSIAFLLAINEGQLGSLPLGAIMSGENLAECLLSALYALQIASINIDTLEMKAPTVTGFDRSDPTYSPGLERIVVGAMDSVYGAVKDALAAAIPLLVESTVMDLFTGDNAIDLLAGVPDSTCPPIEPTAVNGSPYIDFRDLLLPPEVALEYGGSGASPYGQNSALLKEFVSSQFLAIDPTTGLPGISTILVGPMTKKLSGVEGTLVFEDLVDADGRIELGGLNADYKLNIGSLRIENLHSIGAPLELLDPIRNESNMLNNTATFGTAPTGPVRFGASVLFDIATDEQEIRNDFNVTLELSSTNVLVELLASVLESRLMNFPLEDIFNLKCWLATIPAPALDEYGFRVDYDNVTLSLADIGLLIGAANITVECVECNSPKMQELADLLETNHDDASKSVRNVLQYAVGLGAGPFSPVQTMLDRMLVDAPKLCPHRPEFNPDAVKTQYEKLTNKNKDASSTAYLISLLIAIASIIAAVALVWCIVRWVTFRRHRRWLRVLSADQAHAVYANQGQVYAHARAMDQVSKSMFTSDIPLFVRWFVPIVLLGTIALFGSGHFSQGGTVSIFIQVGGDEIVVDDFYTFSIAQSGVELWNAGARELAILILIVSGAWPYLKQLTTLFCWFCPVGAVLPLSRRGVVLTWLDALAKWSMVDVFVMIVTLAAFQVTIRSPNLSFLPRALYQVNMMVIPQWGLYANALAQVVSQITSHVIIHYHRLLVKRATAAVKADTENDVTVGIETADSTNEHFLTESNLSGGPVDYISDDDSEKEHARFPHSFSRPHRGDDVSDDDSEKDLHALCCHNFSRPHRGESETLRIRHWANWGLVASCVILVALVLTGCIMPSFSFDYRGLIGVAIESGMNFEQANYKLSVFGVAQLLMDQARFLDSTKDYVGLAAISVLLTLTTLFVPVFESMLLLVEWFVPLRRRRREALRDAVEILQAWQYIEVFILSVIVGSWQIGDVSEFFVSDYCDGLDGFFATLVRYELLRPEDAQCFRVQAAVEPGSYVLISAAVLLLFLNNFVSRAVAQRNRDEEEAVYATRAVDSDDKGFSLGKIRPVPVLFTDLFRWLLKSS